jgi:hypothetical protein
MQPGILIPLARKVTFDATSKFALMSIAVRKIAVVTFPVNAKVLKLDTAAAKAVIVMEPSPAFVTPLINGDDPAL